MSSENKDRRLIQKTTQKITIENKSEDKNSMKCLDEFCTNKMKQ